MIRGIHGLLYSSNPDATRAFFRDQVRLPGSDIGEGWWIFDFPEGDLGVHPAEDGGDAGKHDVSFYCDQIEKTVRDLQARGVRFTGPVEDHGYGLVTYFEAPGGVRVQLYQPRYRKKPAPRPARKTRRSVRKTTRRAAAVRRRAPRRR
ncbi:MAG TPA: VOC family protein [Myxococcaceae bacterium]|nr:VOC family protein [Myxococcaceae bacterium]